MAALSSRAFSPLTKRATAAIASDSTLPRPSYPRLSAARAVSLRSGERTSASVSFAHATAVHGRLARGRLRRLLYAHCGVTEASHSSARRAAAVVALVPCLNVCDGRCDAKRVTPDESRLNVRVCDARGFDY
ncbi:hypothetical protein OAO87_03060 [bacterium]|nr:hypothetical protein [bacterium]